MSALVTAHVHLDNADVTWIDESNMKVIEVVLDKLAHGWNPEEIHAQHPHLSFSQIHGALSYYYDHQLEIDQVIEQELREVERLIPAVAQCSFRKRLHATGQIP